MTRSSRTRDHLDVITIGKHLAAAPARTLSERGVDVPRRRDCEALHPAGERHLVIGLDEQVNMRALQADVDDPEPLAQRRGDRGVAQRLVHRAPPQAPHLRRHPHHDVQRMVRLELRPRFMSLAGTCAPGLPPCTAPLAAAPKQLLLSSPPRLATRPRRPHTISITTTARPVND
jgi:hypothetical protein